MGKEGLMSLKEIWDDAGRPFQARHFVSKPPPGSPRYHFPRVEVPKHLMSEEDAKAAQGAINAGVRIVGTHAQRRSKVDTPEFQAAEGQFREATKGKSNPDGTSLLGVLKLASQRWIDSFWGR